MHIPNKIEWDFYAFVEICIILCALVIIAMPIVMLITRSKITKAEKDKLDLAWQECLYNHTADECYLNLYKKGEENEK